MMTAEEYREMAEKLETILYPLDWTEAQALALDCAIIALREAAEMLDEAQTQLDAYDAGQSAHTTVGHLRAILLGEPTDGGDHDAI